MKNNGFFGKTDPEFMAIKIIRELELNINEPIDLYYVAEKLNIVIKKEKIKDGILGACKAVGLKRLIVIDPDIDNEGRERFTIAHEIGHVIEHHGVHCCRTEDFYWNSKGVSVEQDANLFAAELLMPSTSLADIVKKNDITMELIEKLASERNVSVTAMAIKLVKLSTDPTVLIYFEGGKVKWASYSKNSDFVELKNTIMSDTFDGMKITKQYEASTFFDGMSDEATCWAEAKYFGNYKFYLCVVRLDDKEYD